jgi:hypothetical protein
MPLIDLAAKLALRLLPISIDSVHYGVVVY